MEQSGQSHSAAGIDSGLPTARLRVLGLVWLGPESEEPCVRTLDASFRADPRGSKSLLDAQGSRTWDESHPRIPLRSRPRHCTVGSFHLESSTTPYDTSHNRGNPNFGPFRVSFCPSPKLVALRAWIGRRARDPTNLSLAPSPSPLDAIGKSPHQARMAPEGSRRHSALALIQGRRVTHLGACFNLGRGVVYVDRASTQVLFRRWRDFLRD